jgi:hypothetical protein
MAATSPPNYFFEQHFKRFHQRPFICHIWDGRKDGFSVLVNYHKLNHEALEHLRRLQTASGRRTWARSHSGTGSNSPGFGPATRLPANGSMTFT